MGVFFFLGFGCRGSEPGGDTCHGESSLLPLTPCISTPGEVVSDWVRFVLWVTVTTLAVASLGKLFTLVVDTLRVTALEPENDVS